MLEFLAVGPKFTRPSARGSAANPPHAAAVVDRQMDGRTDGRTPDRFIDPQDRI